MRKVYIATAFENAERARDLASRLPIGWAWKYDWTGHTYDDDPLEVAVSDSTAVMHADALIMLLPGGPGAHTELGLALGVGIPVCIVGYQPRKDSRWPRCPFNLLGRRVEGTDESLQWLQNLPEAAGKAKS